VRIVLLGCPGAGKGTQARFLARHYHIPMIATGDMLRTVSKSNNSLGLKVKEIMASGSLVPDNIIVTLVKERLNSDDCTQGYLLDGFPRTINQAEALHSAGIELDYIIEIFVPDDDIVKRLSGRYIHPGSGRVYHLTYNPPQIPGVDDITNEPLVQRDDDKEDTIRERLKVYHEKTEPLVSYYRTGIDSYAPKYIKIDGVGTIEEVYARITSAIGTC
jgi:adenylate kinase